MTLGQTGLIVGHEAISVLAEQAGFLPWGSLDDVRRDQVRRALVAFFGIPLPHLHETDLWFSVKHNVVRFWNYRHGPPGEPGAVQLVGPVPQEEP